MSEEFYGFCPSCGANIPEGAVYCPECGSALSSEAETAPGTGVGYATSTGRRPLGGKLLVAVILTSIYAVLEVLTGTIFAFGADAFVNGMNEMLIESGQKSFTEMMAEMGYDYSTQDLIDTLRASGIISAVSGIFAGIGVILAVRRVKRIPATVCIAIASFVPVIGGIIMGDFSGFFSLIIGLIMAYLVYSSPEYFED